MKKICIIGPESSGKTTLALQLSRELNAPMVPEIARAYLSSLDRRYRFEDLLKIGAAQLKAERDAIAQNPEADLLICDTDLLVIYIWSIDKFGRADEQLEELLYKQYYDYCLLCTPDIPWEADPLREDPIRRHELFETYKTLMDQMGSPFQVVEGNREERLNQALKYIGN